jgi:hypothetical protein
MEVVEAIEEATETEIEIEESFAALFAEKLVTKQGIVLPKWMEAEEIEVTEEAAIEVIEEAETDLTHHQEATIDSTIKVAEG